MSKRNISGEMIYQQYKMLLPIWQQDPSKSTGLYSSGYLLGYRQCIEDLIQDIEDGAFND